MPEVSLRGKNVPPSPIRKLVPLAEAAKKRGVHVHHLNIGQPDIETPAEFMDAFRETDMTVLPYGHSAGLWEYRDELVKYYARHDIELTSEEIVVTTGGSEAIVFAMMAVGDHGDEIIIPEPFYTNYNGFAVEAGLTVVPVTCRVEDGFRLPPAEEFERKIGERTRAILVCNPNNPTGHVLTADELERLAGLAVRHDLFLLSDEVYREFSYGDTRVHSLLSMPEIADRAVVLDSISKRYSACGARIGCIATHHRGVLDAALRMGQARLCPPTMEQIAAARAVHTPAAYFDRVLADYEARCDAVFEGLDGIPGVVAMKPGGAFYTIVRLPVADADHFCRWILSDFALDGETVMLAPANGFYATPGLGRDEVRIAFVLSVDELRRSMKLLGAALEAYPGRPA